LPETGITSLSVAKTDNSGVKPQCMGNLSPAHVISAHAFDNPKGLTGGRCQSSRCVALSRRQRSLSARNSRLIAGSHSGSKVRFSLGHSGHCRCHRRIGLGRSVRKVGRVRCLSRICKSRSRVAGRGAACAARGLSTGYVRLRLEKHQRKNYHDYGCDF
jgi:hypothetical protein